MEPGWIVVLVIVVIAWAFLKRNAASSYGPVGTLDGPGTYSIEVVGESHYQGALERACGGRTEESAEKYCKARLVLEDSNEHDPKAVRVDINGETVGYLSRELAREYRKRLEEAGHRRLIGVCDAVIRGGWDRGHGDRGYFGVRLDLPTA